MCVWGRGGGGRLTDPWSPTLCLGVTCEKLCHLLGDSECSRSLVEFKPISAEETLLSSSVSTLRTSPFPNKGCLVVFIIIIIITTML